LGAFPRKPALGSSTDQSDLLITLSIQFEVLKHVDLDGYIINSMIKKANARLRPFVQHPALVQPLFTADDFGYPSGLSSGTELQARVLSTLFPAQSDQLLVRARQVADSRVIAGVHYTSDTLAGIALGDLIFIQLQAKPKFRHELSAAAPALALDLARLLAGRVSC
jgi:hypothetical protein